MMKKTLKIVVLAKQVPDTRNVGKDAMKADGTVNRAALAATPIPRTSMRWSRRSCSRTCFRAAGSRS